ncbi:MAG: cupin domain-containing protein [Angustibacter sp.]
MTGFVVRQWKLAPHEGDQAPLHVHHAGDEAFFVVEGRLEVQDGEQRHLLHAGDLHTVHAGRPHTFATVDGEGAHVLVVMTPEIDALVRALHSDEPQDVDALWAAHHSAIVRSAAHG